MEMGYAFHRPLAAGGRDAITAIGYSIHFRILQLSRDIRRRAGGERELQLPIR